MLLSNKWRYAVWDAVGILTIPALSIFIFTATFIWFQWFAHGSTADGFFRALVKHTFKACYEVTYCRDTFLVTETKPAITSYRDGQQWQKFKN